MLPLCRLPVRKGAARLPPAILQVYLSILIDTGTLVKRFLFLLGKFLAFRPLFARPTQPGGGPPRGRAHSENSGERSNAFQGMPSSGGSAMKRSRSRVTGCVKESEYAHSASRPFLAVSPP